MADDYEIDGLPQHALLIRIGSADDRGVTVSLQNGRTSTLQGFIIANEEDLTFDSCWRGCLWIGAVESKHGRQLLGTRRGMALLLTFAFAGSVARGIVP